MTIWKPVPGLGGFYEASDDGKVRSKARVVEKRSRWGGVLRQFYKERLLKPHIADGYALVHLGFDGKKVGISVHRMVAMAFHGPPPEGQECCHCDGNSLNNHASNLRWDTHFANNQDRKKHGNYPTGQDHPMSKFSEDFLAGVRSGRTGLREAMSKGMSKTHFYRVLKSVSQTDKE